MARNISRSPSAVPVRPARAPIARADRSQENAQYTGGSPEQLTPIVQEPGISGNLGTTEAVVVDEAVTASDLSRNESAAKLVQRFVVEADKTVGINGHRSMLRTGKIIDSLNYDIPKLRAQGVKLKPYVAEA